MIFRVQTILCGCLLKICSIVFGATITSCSRGTVTLENSANASFTCTGLFSKESYWAVNGKDLTHCGITCMKKKGYTVEKTNDTSVLIVTDNFPDFVGNVTCGDMGKNGMRQNVTTCIVELMKDGGWAMRPGNGSCNVTCGDFGFDSTSCNTQECVTTTRFHLQEFVKGGVNAILAERDSIKRRKKALLLRTAALEMTAQFLAKFKSDQSKESSTKQDLRSVWSTLEDVGPVIAVSLDVGEVKTEKQTNLESVFAKTDRTANYLTYQFSDSSYFELSPMNTFNTVSNRHNDSSIGLCAFYIENIENIVYDLISTNDPSKVGGSRADDVTQTVVNTQVMMIAVRVGDVSRQNLQLSKNISLTMKMKSSQGLTQPACVSFEAESLSPTSAGCYSQQLNSTHVRCLCNHLTSFAVVMSVVEVDDTDPVLDMLSSICLSLSCFCLLLATLTFYSFSSLRWSRFFTLGNLSLSLGLAQLLYLFGINQVSNKVVCSVIAGLLHFLFLAAFCWMGADGLQLFFKLVTVHKTPRKTIPIYVLIGYGVPTIIVAISAGLRYDGYGTKTHCWLSYEGWFHMAFIGPVLVIIIWNTIMFFISMVIMRRYLHGSSSDVKKQFKGAVTVLAVLGIPWIFGLIQFNNRATTVFSYIFILLNGTQGVFIFLFQCVFNKQVRTEYYLALVKSRVFPALCKLPLLDLLSRHVDKSKPAALSRSNTVTMEGKQTKATSTFKSWPKPMEAAVPEYLMTPDDKLISLVSTEVYIPGKPLEIEAAVPEYLMTPDDKLISLVTTEVDIPGKPLQMETVAYGSAHKIWPKPIEAALLDDLIAPSDSRISIMPSDEDIPGKSSKMEADLNMGESGKSKTSVLSVDKPISMGETSTAKKGSSKEESAGV